MMTSPKITKIFRYLFSSGKNLNGIGVIKSVLSTRAHHLGEKKFKGYTGFTYQYIIKTTRSLAGLKIR